MSDVNIAGRRAKQYVADVRRRYDLARRCADPQFERACRAAFAVMYDWANPDDITAHGPYWMRCAPVVDAVMSSIDMDALATELSARADALQFGSSAPRKPPTFSLLRKAASAIAVLTFKSSQGGTLP